VQAAAVPVIAAGNGFTVTTRVALHPVESVYEIVDVPFMIPLTTPVDRSTVATAVLPLVQLPPSVALARLVERPIQTLAVPEIAAGSALTVTIACLKHPVGNVYVIEAVPAETPVNTPALALIVATDVLPLLHIPPVTGLDKDAVSPWQTAIVPVISPGNELTVIVAETEQPVPTLYVIETVPAETPVTTPDSSMVATERLPLVQEPPETSLLSDVVAPIHTAELPVIDPGIGLTITVVVREQPAPKL
jgi:hypothetical protein